MSDHLDKIENIIFDLGNVLIRWGPHEILTKSNPGFSRLFNDGANSLFYQIWKEFDRGRMSESQLIQEFSGKTNLSPETIILALTQLKESLTVIPEMETVLHDCQQQGLSLYCLSNISKSYSDFLISKFGIFQYFKDMLFSYEVCSVKPETRIYEIMINRFQLVPGQTLFIDDMEENILSAGKQGFKSILYSNHDQFCIRLSQFLGSSMKPNSRVIY